MQTSRIHSGLWRQAEQQAAIVPQIYGGIDFSALPERFTVEPSGDGFEDFNHLVPGLMKDDTLVDLMAVYTMTGDAVADAYAARIADYGFGRLVRMLEVACDAGIGAVRDAPPELAALIVAMERTPGWLDMDLVDKGARIERNHYVHLVPFAIRGAFLATFMNKYSALPMAMTGNLTDSLAARRVQDTATFFTLTVMPGALRRYGPAFKAAAKVRLMHAMVRLNVMRQPGAWDSRVYGVPIPQVDQMPAGQIGSLLIAFQALREGRETFTADERARIEIARYRCFLLGLPEVLLGDTPRAIARLMMARQATLRAGFDDATCGALVRGTMNTELAFDPSLQGRIDRELERSFSKAFFIRHFLRGDTARARKMGVTYTLKDRKLALVAAARIYSQLNLFKALADIPVVRDVADRLLVGKLNGLLKRYGRGDPADAGGHMARG